MAKSLNCFCVSWFEEAAILAIVLIYSWFPISTYSSFPQQPKRIPPTRPCSRPRYPVSREFLLLRRHHPPSHCCFFRWYHWFGSNSLLLCGAFTKQARLPQQARAVEAVGSLSNELVSFVDFLGLVSNIINEGSANPGPHSAQRCGSSCCGSVRWWASISSMGRKPASSCGRCRSLLWPRASGDGWGGESVDQQAPTGLAAMDEPGEGSRNPAQEGQGRASDLLQPLPAAQAEERRPGSVADPLAD